MAARPARGLNREDLRLDCWRPHPSPGRSPTRCNRAHTSIAGHFDGIRCGHRHRAVRVTRTQFGPWPDTDGAGQGPDLHRVITGGRPAPAGAFRACGLPEVGRLGGQAGRIIAGDCPSVPDGMADAHAVGEVTDVSGECSKGPHDHLSDLGRWDDVRHRPGKPTSDVHERLTAATRSVPGRRPPHTHLLPRKMLVDDETPSGTFHPRQPVGCIAGDTSTGAADAWCDGGSARVRSLPPGGIAAAVRAVQASRCGRADLQACRHVQACRRLGRAERCLRPR